MVQDVEAELHEIGFGQMALQAGCIADDEVDVFRSMVAAGIEGNDVLGVGSLREKLPTGESAAVVLFFQESVKVFRCDFLRLWLLHSNM